MIIFHHLFDFNSGAGVIAILANSTVMLAQLQMTRVQFVFEKVVSVTYATIPPQVQGIIIFGLTLQTLAAWMICIHLLHSLTLYNAFITPP
jgi:hypothetical protein